MCVTFFFVVVRNRVVVRRKRGVGVPYVNRTETSGRSWKRCQVALETTGLCYAKILSFFGALTGCSSIFLSPKKKYNYFFLNLW